jgi:formylmethanofuran dehydrogenase subunit E-like metal-binding protein
MKTGDHVYCVDPHLSQKTLNMGIKKLQYKAYIIRDIEEHGHAVGLRVEELDNTDTVFYEIHGIEPSYNQKRFTPMEFDDLEFEMMNTLTEEPELEQDIDKLTAAINDRYDKNYDAAAVAYQYYLSYGIDEDVNDFPNFLHNPFLNSDSEEFLKY